MNERNLFGDQERLYLLLNFREKGYAKKSLALIFHCDKKAITYQCQKYSIDPKGKNLISIAPIITQIIERNSRWRLLDGEMVNKGMMYKDYIKLYSPSRPTSKG